MALELRHLRYLLAVAEHNNFTRAAKDLHVSQPTLSQQIKQLERTVGAQLLDRTGRNVRLTEAGESYVHYARCALRDLAAAERAVLDIADLSRGHLRLALTQTSTAYLLGPLTAELHSRHPGITLDVKEMTQDQIEASLLADELDLGIAFHGPHLPGITAAALCTETLSLVIGAHQPGAGREEPLHVRDLEGRQLALLNGGFITRVQVDDYFTAHKVQPHIAVEANSVPVLIEIVRRTSLATVLPDAITDDNPDLAPVPLEPALPARTVTLLRRESAYQSAAARAFIHLTEQFVDACGCTPPDSHPVS